MPAARLIHALPFAFALLFWASYHPLDLGFLAHVALVPLLLYAKLASGKRAFWIAFAGGWCAFASGFFWVRYTVPIAPYLLGLYGGLYVAAFVAIARKVGPLWAAPAWVGLEFARAHLFGGIPWFLLGYTQHAAFNLIQIADLGGVWLVSLLVAFVNGAVVDGRRAARWAAGGAVAASMLYGLVRVPAIVMEDGPRIAVVQPNIPQDLKLIMASKDPAKAHQEAVKIYRRHLKLTVEAATHQPDLVVWPEAAIYYGLEWRAGAWYDDSWYRRVLEVARTAESEALLGLMVQEKVAPGQWVYTNSAVRVDADRGILDRFDKAHLVPFAEYVPGARSVPWIRELIRKYSGLTVPDQRPGQGYPIWTCAGKSYGVQICFEAIFPEISREIAGKGAAFTVNISNDGWFRDSAELDQMQAMARFRSIENRMHVIRATNTGISAFNDPTGREQAVLEVGGRRKEVEGILVARPRVTSSGSLYRTLGDGVAWAALLASAGVLAARIFVDRKKKAA